MLDGRLDGLSSNPSLATVTLHPGDRVDAGNSARRAPVVALDDVLDYRNPRVIGRYLKDFGGSRQEAQLVFVALLKWLYLAYLAKSFPRKRPVKCLITLDIAKLDDMWHTFLLFTRDYGDFCSSHFGRFIHHDPNTGEGPRGLEEAQRELRRFHALVYDTLGAETFQDWYLRGRFERPKKRRAPRANASAGRAST